MTTPTAPLSPANLAGIVRDAIRTGRPDELALTAIASDSLMRDVAIAELLVLERPIAELHAIATSIYAQRPAPQAASFFAALDTLGPEIPVLRIPRFGEHDDRLTEHIAHVREMIPSGAGSVPVGELAHTTAFAFTAEDHEDTPFEAREFDTSWNGWAAPILDRDELLRFLTTTEQGVRVIDTPSGEAVILTWDTTELAPNESPLLEEITTYSPAADGYYHVDGYTLTRVADTITEPLDVWNVVQAQVERKHAAWEAGHPDSIPSHLQPGELAAHALLADNDGQFVTRTAPDAVLLMHTGQDTALVMQLHTTDGSAAYSWQVGSTKDDSPAPLEGRGDTSAAQAALSTFVTENIRSQQTANLSTHLGQVSSPTVGAGLSL